MYLPAVSLFSNCGAGDLGYAEAGFDFRVLAEIDKRRLSVALINHPGSRGVPGDLRQTSSEVVAAYRDQCADTRPALLAACPPCQGMSSARARRGREDDPAAGARDYRNLLVEVIADVVQALWPRLLVVENVSAFLRRLVQSSRLNVAESAARVLIRHLQPNYRVFPFLVDLADYGVPQRRVRAFLTFVHRAEPALALLERAGLVPYPRPSVSPHVTLAEALTDLAAGALDAGSPERANDAVDPMHSVPVWGSDWRYRMVSLIDPGSGGSAWENDRCDSCGEVGIAPDLALCPLCSTVLPRPVVRKSDGTYRLVRGFRRSSYSRMLPDRPAATITTASGSMGSDFTLHPFENRVLSPRECAHLQTFPLDFRWGPALEESGSTNVRAMIGEAVPPRFTSLHGRTIRQLLEGRLDERFATAGDQRSSKAVFCLSP